MTPEPGRRRFAAAASRSPETAPCEGLGVAFRYAVAEETQRGELEHFRIAGQPPLERNLHIARLARRGFSSSECGSVTTLTRCCAKNGAYAGDCVA